MKRKRVARITKKFLTHHVNKSPLIFKAFVPSSDTVDDQNKL